jgi:hypothetical protein
MQRRSYLAAVGSVAAAGAAAVGTGAFSYTQAERGIGVDVAGDANGYLGLEATGPHAEMTSDGRLELNFDGSSSATGTGVNGNAYQFFRNVFEITNQGTNPVAVFLSDGSHQYDNPLPSGPATYLPTGTLGPTLANAGVFEPASRANESIFWPFSGEDAPDTDPSGNDVEYGIDDQSVLRPDNVDAGIFRHPVAHPGVLDVGEAVRVGFGLNTTNLDEDPGAIGNVDADVVFHAYSKDYAENPPWE